MTHASRASRVYFFYVCMYFVIYLFYCMCVIYLIFFCLFSCRQCRQICSLVDGIHAAFVGHFSRLHLQRRRRPHRYRYRTSAVHVIGTRWVYFACLCMLVYRHCYSLQHGLIFLVPTGRGFGRALCCEKTSERMTQQMDVARFFLC